MPLNQLFVPGGKKDVEQDGCAVKDDQLNSEMVILHQFFFRKKQPRRLRSQIFWLGTNWKNQTISSSAWLLIRHKCHKEDPTQLHVPVHCNIYCNMINGISMLSKDLLGRVSWLYCSGWPILRYPPTFCSWCLNWP